MAAKEQGSVKTSVLIEAFRRAQIAGRAFPALCDFPPWVSSETVHAVYYPALQHQVTQRAAGVQAEPRTYLTQIAATDASDSALLTYAGDAVAASHLVMHALRDLQRGPAPDHCCNIKRQ